MKFLFLFLGLNVIMINQIVSQSVSNQRVETLFKSYKKGPLNDSVLENKYNIKWNDTIFLGRTGGALGDSSLGLYFFSGNSANDHLVIDLKKTGTAVMLKYFSISKSQSISQFFKLKGVPNYVALLNNDGYEYIDDKQRLLIRLENYYVITNPLSSETFQQVSVLFKESNSLNQRHPKFNEILKIAGKLKAEFFLFQHDLPPQMENFSN